MRLLIIVLAILLFLAILGFVITNLDTEVDLTVGTRTYDSIALYVIVIASLLIGIGYAGIVAVAEGVNIRLTNRRLSREIRKLETEINYLRTQPPTAPSREPDELPSDPALPPAEEGVKGRTGAPASAPIYEPDSGEWEGDDDDDDFYTGGRAV